MTGTAAWRSLLLLLAIALCLLRFAWVWMIAKLEGRPISRHDRALWMHFCGRTTLRALGLGKRIEGAPPRCATLLVSNHLSYLDILISSAAFPSIFVAKSEVADWPVFGMLARLGGTLFVDRESPTSAWDTAVLMQECLAEGVPVTFYPEGTSSDGSSVLRFRSTLFQSATELGTPVTSAAIRYEPESAVAERELCWYGDDAFLPHLLRVLGGTGFTAVVRFSGPEIYPDRRTAAWRTHDTVSRLREQGLVFP